MKNKHLIIIIIILSVIAIVTYPKKEAKLDKKDENKTIFVKVKDQDTGVIKTLDLENYVVGVVAGEMPASFEMEALKAGAVAARTYAMYKINNKTSEYDLVTDVTNQVYLNNEKMKEKWQDNYDYYFARIKKAVEDTSNLVITYEGEIISSYYFAMSNGKTENSELVFGEAKDYLQSVDSKKEETLTTFKQTVKFSKSDFCSKLQITCENITITDIQKTASGRVDTIVIGNHLFKGTKVRQALNLRSTDFEITVGDDIIITTNGYGHGVGMSQYGANIMAKDGASFEEILKHYYQNTQITKLSV